MRDKEKKMNENERNIEEIEDESSRSGKDSPEINDSFSADRVEDTGESVAAEREVESGEINGQKTPGAEEIADEKKAEEKEEESERYLRLAAEFENFKKRTAREFSEVMRTANVRIIRELVEIQDNFERALTAEAGSHNLEAFREGVELIYNQLTGLLEKEQVKKIEAIGKPFDPNLHEAMMQSESEEYDEGIVCGEIQKGYTIGDRVVRHARVIVSTGPANTEVNESTEGEGDIDKNG
jgi:molecular chaperone GrpE